jgi:hypothetical protein
MENEGATKIQIIGYFKSPSAIMTEIENHLCQGSY